MVDNPRKKSPRSPSLTLENALEMGRKIYERERTHSAPTDVAAQALGYKNANNGAALSALASLRYFGIVERPKDGFLAVAKKFESYMFAPDENLRRSLVCEFLKSPPLYKEMLEKYEAGLPSDANLKFELIQKGFSPQASEAAIGVFRKSVEFCDYYNQFSSPPMDDPKPDAEISRDEPVVSSAKLADLRLEGPDVVWNEASPGDADKIPVRLPGGRRAWLLIPTPFYEADKARIKAQIDLLLTEDEN